MQAIKDTMTQIDTIMKNDVKQRLTAFVDPILVKRAKVRGALEGLTISEVVEKALDVYAPKIEKGSDKHINIKFLNYPAIDTVIPETASKTTTTISKHIKGFAVSQ
jgi:hypothetical protein